MLQPLKNMGEMWVLFREKKMYTSTDGGETWQFGRDMDDASQPEAYNAHGRKDLGTADQVACGQEAVGEVLHDTVEGQFASSALQGALMHSKYWIKQDTGFISQHETRSDGAGGAFYALQIIEQVPGLELPKVD
jgi:hypothetical protein